jgi:hypothetical protein
MTSSPQHPESCYVGLALDAKHEQALRSDPHERHERPRYKRNGSRGNERPGLRGDQSDVRQFLSRACAHCRGARPLPSFTEGCRKRPAR